jgi:hypothetical protein
MRALEWSAVKGRGLQASYLYVRAGCSIDGGVEGRDYFAGDDSFAAWWLSEGRRLAPQDDDDDKEPDPPPTPPAHSPMQLAQSTPRADEESPLVLAQSTPPQSQSPIQTDQPAVAGESAVSSTQDAVDRLFGSQPVSPRPDSTQDVVQFFGSRPVSPAHSQDQYDGSDTGGFSQLPASSLPSSFVALLDAASSMGEEEASDEDDQDEQLQPPTQGASQGASLDPDDVNKIENLAELDDWDSEADEGADEGVFEEDSVPQRQHDDDDDNDRDDGELIDRAFLDSLGGEVRVNAGSVNADALRATRWAPVTDQFEDDSTQAYTGLTSSPGGPDQRLVEVFDNPAALFFAFFPRSLWKSIASESNRYERQTRTARANALIATQRRRRAQAQDDTITVEDMATVKTRMRLTPAIEAWKVVRAVGLLVANVLCTHRTGIRNHWSTSGRGAIPSGNFGLVMARNRFWHIMRHLHFTDNNQRAQITDKAWKIRPIVSVLQDRFRTLWQLTPTLSFDEGVLPSTSRMNTTRLYMPDKPHKWGTKLFMTCDSETSYCFRYFFCAFQHVV